MLTVGKDDLSLWGDSLVFDESGLGVVGFQGPDWADYKSADKVSDGPCNLAMTHVGGLPALVSQMERHDHTREVLFCAESDVCVAVCAGELTSPQAEHTVTVLIPRGSAFVMHRGTWHSACYGVDGPARYYWLAVSDPRYPGEWIDIDGGPVPVERIR